MSRRARNGYTFIELTVVLVIIATVAAVGMPRLLSWVNEGNLGAASRELAGLMRYVRNEAARRQKVFYLAIDFEENAYWVETRRDPREVHHSGYYVSWEDPDDEDFEPFEDEFITRRELRKLIVFDRVVYGDLTEDRFGKVRIAFRPDGTTRTVAIYLKNTQDMVATVVLNGDTGRVEMHEYAYDLEAAPVLYEQYDHDE